MDIAAAPQQSDDLLLPEAGQPRRRVRRGIDGALSKFPPYRFAKNLFKDNNFWTRIGGAWYGGIFIAEGVAGKGFLFALPLLPHLLAVTISCAAVGIGICGLGYGLAGAWNSIENVCAKSFRTFNPLRITRLRARDLVKGISATPLMQKLHRAKKTADAPLDNNKLLNSRVAGIRHGLTPRQRDIFLAGMTIEGSLAAIAYCTVHTAGYMAALPAVTAGGILTLGMAAVAYVVGTGVFDLYCSVKTLKQSHRAKKSARSTAAEDFVPEPAMSAPEMNARPMPVNTAASFNDKSVRTAPAAAVPFFVTANPPRRAASPAI